MKSEWVTWISRSSSLMVSESFILPVFILDLSVFFVPLGERGWGFIMSSQSGIPGLSFDFPLLFSPTFFYLVLLIFLSCRRLCCRPTLLPFSHNILPRGKFRIIISLLKKLLIRLQFVFLYYLTLLVPAASVCIHVCMFV